MDNRNNKTGGRNGVLGIIIRKYMMLFVLIGLFVFLTIISRVFLNPRNIMNLFRQVSVIGIISIGAGTVVIGGTFDMSVGSLCTMTGCACLLMQQRMPVLPAVLLTLLIGIGTGFVNGFIITGIKGNSGDSFMVTYGMLTVLQAIALVITGGYPLNPSKSAAYNAIGSGTIGPIIPVSIIIFFVLAAIAAVVLQKTVFGKEIYYIGANPVVAKLSGINVTRNRIAAYMISGLCASMAAIVLTGRINGATAKMGHGFEFDAMTALVVGGISLSGGIGNMINMIIGVFIMGTLSNGLNILGVQSENQYVARGLVLIIAVLVDVLKSRRMSKEV